jgi:capsular exopolysaccharide synthesis family protein
MHSSSERAAEAPRYRPSPNVATVQPENVDEHLVTLRHRSSPEAEPYNALRYALEARGGDNLRAVAVTSPAAGDGKTTTAINLAGALAHRRDGRVLLVDVDLRRPSVGPRLGLANDTDPAGLVDAILDADLTLEDVVTQLPAFNLWLLPAGRFTDEPFELLRTARMKELVQQARREYDFVVLDTSPLLLFPDARILENWIDAFLLVVAAHRTPRKLVEDAVNLLSPSKLIGLVFNGDDRPLSRHYGDSYGYSYAPPRAGTSPRRPRWP